MSGDVARTGSQVLLEAPAKVIDVELTRSLRPLEDLAHYRSIWVLLRLDGVPVGSVRLPLVAGGCSPTHIAAAVSGVCLPKITRQLLCELLLEPGRSGPLSMADLGRVPNRRPLAGLPTVTAAVCTRNRPRMLVECLHSLSVLEYPGLEVIVIDNAPADDSTKRVVARFPQVRYVCEVRPGLDWARNRAILEAKGEVIAFTDDDARVDPGWVDALAAVFADGVDVMAVTGLVAPYELETNAQVLFERHGGFGRGFERRWNRVDGLAGELAARHHGGSGKFGTGANMAYRRCVFDEVGLFDPALDVGTVTNGGGDIEMFFRVVKFGHTLVYEPRALVWHCHRSSFQELLTQVFGHGVGFISAVIRSSAAYPEERFGFLNVVRSWVTFLGRRLLLASTLRRGRYSSELVRRELMGIFCGYGRYGRARAASEAIERRLGSISSEWPVSRLVTSWRFRRSSFKQVGPWGTAVLTVDIDQPLQDMHGLEDYASVRIHVLSGGNSLGHVDIAHRRQPISAARLAQVIADRFGLALVAPGEPMSPKVRTELRRRLAARLPALQPEVAVARPESTWRPTVSVIIPTLDRPDELHACLVSVTAQETSHSFEIVVVDNNPRSGLTLPVAARFADVVLVSEQRRGMSCARNAGICASTGDILITSDDDVTAPPGWLESLIQPFRTAHVSAVTGAVLLPEPKTRAERLLHAYREFSDPTVQREYDRTWLHDNQPALGARVIGTASNAAFRSDVLSDPRVGLFDETLGGTAAGDGDGAYLFARILSVGYTIHYEPLAWVLKQCPRTLRELCSHLRDSGRSVSLYHIRRMLRDGDVRSLQLLGLKIPAAYARRMVTAPRGDNRYPLWVPLVELMGVVEGLWCYLRGSVDCPTWEEGPYMARPLPSEPTCEVT